jgi:hypothetical protein
MIKLKMKTTNADEAISTRSANNFDMYSDKLRVYMCRPVTTQSHMFLHRTVRVRGEWCNNSLYLLGWHGLSDCAIGGFKYL